jgi:protein involved in polysaccharide export with SLBB domain
MRGIVFGLWLLAAGFGLGCAQGGAPRVAAPQPLAPGEYRIQRGDELEIRFALNPELDSDSLVLPDGRISLQLVGDMYAEGLTPAELTEQLRNAYSTELRDPDIAVNVARMAARIYVGGHIERPGEYAWSRQITAMQAIARAGGFSETADTSRIIVLRRDKSGAEQTIEIDIDDATSDEGKNRDVYLAPYDLVMVPSSTVADVNKWMDQYIRKNIPLSPRDILPRDGGGGGGGGGGTDVGPVP